MIEAYFKVYGEITSLLVREPDPQTLSEKIPEEKRKFILAHKYAFVCFKNPEAAKKIVNEVSYLKVSDKNFNNELNSLVELLKKQNVAQEHLFSCACYILENVDGYKNLINDSTKLQGLYEQFRNVNKIQ
jgi:RNA recognition motif-containing protein